MSIYSNSVKKPITTLMIFIGVLVLGAFSLSQLPIDLYPDMEPPYLSVIAPYPGANASDIEENITKVLEDRLNSVKDLKKITSKSMDNLAVVSLEFEWGTNLDEASNEARDAIDMAMQQLPDDTDRPTLFKFNTSMIPIVMYTITAEESYPGIKKILEDKVVNRLNRIEGVAAASVMGTPERAIYIDLDPHILSAHNLSIETISSIITAENRDMPSGTIKMGESSFNIKVEGQFDNSERFRNISIPTSNGRILKLSDIATVKDTIKDISYEQLIEREQGAVLMITKQSGANSVKVAKEVRETMDEVVKEIPEDIKIDVLFDTSDFIVKSINNLSSTILYALIAVVLVVLFFLGHWRATFIIALTIPISLIVAFIYLFMTGSTLNIISLTSLSIAIGMVVDDAIVVLENITKHTERGTSPRDAAKYGTNEVWLSVIATTLVVIAVFLPLTMVKGMTGILFKELGWLICITVSVSTIAAISLTPMLSSILLKAKNKSVKKRNLYTKVIEPFLDAMDLFYEKLIRYSLRHRGMIIITSVIILILSFALAKFIKTDFIPKNDNGQINIYAMGQIGQRVEVTKETAFRLDSIIREVVPEVKIINLSYGSMEGDQGAQSLFNKTGNHIINVRVKLVDPEDRNRSAFDIADVIRKEMKKIPDIINYTVTSGNQGFGTGKAIEVEIIGHDFETTSLIATQISDELKKRAGVGDVSITRDDDMPELRFIPDRVKLAENGVSTSQLALNIRNQVYGARPGKYKEEGQEYDIIVRLDEDYRSSISNILDLEVVNNRGKRIKIRELGSMQEVWTPPMIEHQNKVRIVKVEVEPMAGVALGTIAETVKDVIDNVEDVPNDVSIYRAGTYKDQQESFASIIMLMLLALMLVYIVMASQFESFKMPFIIMLSIPFAFSGVIFALLLTNTTLSIIAALGAVMLIGIVTKNGIVLIDYINLLRERGLKLNEAIAQAGRSRIRPVLMTAATTILGMLPMALSVGEGAESWRPMGIAIIGGLIFSTIITMIIVPVVYSLMNKSGGRNKKRKLQSKFIFMKDFDKNKELKTQG